MIPTVSLETAKLLKENGFPQDSEKVFTHPWKSWVYSEDTSIWIIIDSTSRNNREFISAHTTDELLEELPYHIKYKGHGSSDLLITKGSKIYSVRYMDSYCFPHRTKAYCQALFTRELLPEALSLMWLHLNKEGLL